jgi:DnaJ-class molecular chaperone
VLIQPEQPAGAPGFRINIALRMEKAVAGKKDDEKQSSPSQVNPGDEASPGTPGTGEDICSVCKGTGKVDGRACSNCAGTGKVIHGIGGA